MGNFNKEEYKIKVGENKTYDVVLEYGNGTPKLTTIDDFNLPKTPNHSATNNQSKK